MKKKFLATLLATTLALALMACGNDETKEPAKEKKVAEESTEPKKESNEVTYQSILDEYTQKITDAVPGLVEEYNAESAERAGDINALAELSNAKIAVLAEISNEGISKMATLMQTNGDEYATYEEWAGKLTEVYMTQAQPITDAYMNSATPQ